MKNPNGYGGISKVKKNLRKPYNVRITIGRDKDNKQIRKSLGYYATREEAEAALKHFRETGFSIDYLDITFEKLWAEWLEIKLSDESLVEHTRKSFKYSYDKISDEIKHRKFKDIQFRDVQKMFLDLKKTANYETLRKLKSDMNQVFEYAENSNIIQKNFMPNIDIGKSKKKGQALILNEVQIYELWRKINCGIGNEQAMIATKITLMLIYNGCRISEFLDLKTKDVHISDGYFKIRNAKTEAGNRNVPIHSSLKGIYEEFFDSHNEYFLICKKTRKKYSYKNFRDSYFDQLRDAMGWDENITPHNLRKTLASLLKKYGVDPTYQKLILGHEGALDLTEKTYTYVSPEQLVEAINKIPSPHQMSMAIYTTKDMP